MNQLNHSELQQVAGSKGSIMVYPNGTIIVCNDGRITIFGNDNFNIVITVGNNSNVNFYLDH